jgi:hypothetical protein
VWACFFSNQELLAGSLKEEEYDSWRQAFLAFYRGGESTKEKCYNTFIEGIVLGWHDRVSTIRTCLAVIIGSFIIQDRHVLYRCTEPNINNCRLFFAF